MRTDLVDGLTVDIKNTSGGWVERAGKILKYEQECFYKVMIYRGVADLIVHEDDLRPAHPLTVARRPMRGDY